MYGKTQTLEAANIFQIYKSKSLRKKVIVTRKGQISNVFMKLKKTRSELQKSSTPDKMCLRYLRTPPANMSPKLNLKQGQQSKTGVEPRVLLCTGYREVLKVATFFLRSEGF